MARVFVWFAVTAAIQEAVAAGGWGGPPPVLVDCGADHRLTDADAWARFYGTPYAETWTSIPYRHGSEHGRLLHYER